MRARLGFVLALSIGLSGPSVKAQSPDGALNPRAAPEFPSAPEPDVPPVEAPPQPPPTTVVAPPVDYDGRWAYVYDGGGPVPPDPRAERLRWFRFSLTCVQGERCDPVAGAGLAPACVVDEMLAFVRDCPAPAQAPPWANSVIR